MKFSALAFSFFLFFIISQKTVFAQTISTDPMSASSSALPSQVDQNTAASQTINSIKSFIVNLDQFAGGFVFATPEDLFSDSVHLKDGTAINNLGIFRNIFLAISVPITAILILWVGGFNITRGSISYIKPFLGRIIYFVALALVIPMFLSATVKVENSLTTSILNAPVLAKPESDLTSFASDLYTKADQQIASGKSTPESLGIANVGWTNFFSNISHALVVVSLALVALIALLLGILFILAQFALRFLGLLFLSLIYPLVLPFVITKQTEGMFYSFLRIWFTFIIHQPAFALGYMMVMMIARSILDHQGVSLGLFFLYIVSLFFLGTVNVLAARIFADAWVALGTNLEAKTLGSNLVSGVLWGSGMTWKNRGNILNGARSLGRGIKDGFNHTPTPIKRVPNLAFTPSTVDVDYRQKMLNQGIRGGVDTIYGSPSNGYSTSSKPVQANISGSSQINSTALRSQTIPSYAKDFNKKGFFVKQTDKQNGIYSVSGTGYSFYDSKNNISHTFPSKRDGLDSGYREDQLRKVTLSKKNIIDPSQFPRENPHNATATIQAKKMGYPSNYAHITKRSDAVRVKHNLEMNEGKFKNLNVHGYMTKHWDNPNGAKSSKRATTRIISVGEIEN